MNGEYKEKEIMEKKQNKKRKWSLKLLPLQFVLAVLPLILYLKMDFSGFSVYPWNSEGDLYLDIFLQGKMVVFELLSVLLLGLLVYKLVKLDRQTRKQSLIRFIPMFIYMFFVLLSTICSENLTYSLLGSMDAKEPMGVLLGYAILVMYVYLAVESMDDVKQLMGAAVVGSTCMAIIGVMQAIGKDPLLLEWVQKLFAGEKYVENYGTFELTFTDGMTYGTLFNPNYVGTYVAMYAPLVLMGLVIYRQIWKKVICGLTFLGLLVMLFASQSRTGLIAIIAVAVVGALFLGSSIWKRWYIVIPGITLLVAAFFLVDAHRDNILTNRLVEMFKLRTTDIPIKGIDTTGNGVRVKYKDTEFTIKMLVGGNGFSYVVTEGNKQLDVSYDIDMANGYVTLSNGDEIEIKTAFYESSLAFCLEINGRDFFFSNQLVAGNYKYINELGRLDECVMPANVFPGYETAASGRGYAWGRTIPLLKNHLFVGSGPDTYAIVFPQNDYVARYMNGFDNIIFTRPHNFYLQMGIQTGVLSLVAFLVFYITYFVKGCKLYFFRKYRSQEEWTGFALFLCTIGFMAAGIANDSLIVVTPIFYLLLGTGMAVNQKLCPEKEIKTNMTEEGK